MKIFLMETHWDALNLPEGVEHFPHEHKWRLNGERTEMDPFGRAYCTVCGGKPSFFSVREEDDQSFSVQSPYGSVQRESEFIIEQDPPSKLVVHCKKEKYDVYIGRPSKWGNPFTHHKYPTAGEVVVESREEAIKCYENWLSTRPDLIEAAKKELKGKVLGCWCDPLDCHGHVLAKIANEE